MSEEDATEEQESTALVVVYPRAETPYRDFAVEVGELVATAVGLTVTDRPGSKLATDHLGALKDRRVAIEAFKRELLGPLKQRTTDINEAMNELLEPLGNAKKFVDGLILAFNEAERQKVRQVEDIARKERELAELKDEPAPDPTPLPAQPQAVTRGEHTNSNERILTKYEVVDFAALPDTYKKLDAGALTSAVKAGGMTISIPGVHIYQERILATG